MSNLRQKAKRWKGTYRYNLTVCKGYRKTISYQKKKIEKLEKIVAELKAKLLNKVLID